jgi:deazaflavin-dependent oxidoreductase (nitroreductase family)
VAYLRPNAFQRGVFNGLASRFGIGGAQALVVAGRRSGRPQSVPVIPVSYEGARYIVSTRGEAQWVRNLRAAGNAEITRRGKSERFTVSEVPVAERGPILAAYRALAGRTVAPYFKALPDPADHPVFRIEPRG